MLPWVRLLVKHCPLRTGPSRTIFSLSSTQKAEHISDSSLELARTIRRAVEGGEVDRGYQIFTTTCSGNPATSESQYKQNRLLAHVLIHTLHRCQKPLTAASFTKLCLDRRIDISKRTFNTVFSGISPHLTSDVPGSPLDRGMPMGRAPSLTAALSLLSAARKSGHEHSSWMYDRIINAMLLQGEVLTATFLFIALVREWNYRRQLQLAEGDEEMERDTDNSKQAGRSFATAHSTWSDRRTNSLLNSWMNSITSEHHNRISVSGTPEEMSRNQAFRGLDALVSLLNDAKIDIPNRWRLLRVMYLIPYNDFPEPSMYHRWHTILLEYCQGHRGQQNLDLPSYHILLHYAFIYRQSVDLAAAVLQRLCQSHEPSPVTYNILLHGFLSIHDQDNFTSISDLIATRGRQLLDPLRQFNKPDAMKVRHDILQELRKHPVPRPDEYTITAHMSNSIALGKPHLVCILVSRLFPTMRSFYSRKQHGADRANLQRVDRFSPHFWSIAVHAAYRAGDLSFTMAIWRLVIRAEKHGRRQQPTFHSIYAKEAYTSHIYMFSRIVYLLQRRMKKVVDSGNQLRPSHIRATFKLFRVVLHMVNRVLMTLRDRLVYDTPLGYHLDTLLIGSMMRLVDNLINVQRYICIVGDTIVHQVTKNPTVDYTDTHRLDGVIGIAHHILRIHGITMPNEWREYKTHSHIQGHNIWLGELSDHGHLLSAESVEHDSEMAMWNLGPVQVKPPILRKAVDSIFNTSVRLGGESIVVPEPKRDFTYLTNLLRSR
jgi:hypothetical protein